ncbi:hypothetical protein TNCV_5045811 [Trichonephila clavipes]|uniref:Uncharacterized protein n=1 Tax=Trichonephila clavipes TaxID=2585209 RepID=A0A8X7BLW9_TRICX|nr:hypothetical protein TNCV_5045811 [Trichonephila clavipes]
MSSSPVTLKIRRVGQRCPSNLSKDETSSRVYGNKKQFSYHIGNVQTVVRIQIVLRTVTNSLRDHQNRWLGVSSVSVRFLHCEYVLFPSYEIIIFSLYITKSSGQSLN